MAVDESVAAGNAALQAGRWQDARVAFAAALQKQETAEALLGMGEALWWLGEPHPSVEYHERAYAAFRRAGDAPRAAWTAMWLCLAYRSDFGNPAAASGWLARAERVLQDVDPGPLWGWLWLVRAGDPDDLTHSRNLAERALELARGSGDLDLELCALGALGAALVQMGQVEQGLALIDEAMAGTLGGERNRFFTVVFTSCYMLAACEHAADLARATQWCRVVDAFIRQYGCPFLHAYCRIAYGGILVTTGRWADAERELLAAIRMTQDTWPAMHAQALGRLADLRLRQGRLEEAEGLLAGVDHEGATALSTAVVRMARGEPDSAAALLERRLSLHGEDDLEAAPALELLVEAHVARGDLGKAAAAAGRLEVVAAGQGHHHVAARAALAAGRVAAARGEVGTAIRRLERSLDLFTRLDLPPEAARARLELARAMASDQPASAVTEARSALAAFERLGAAAAADAAAALLRSLGAQGRSGPKRVGVLTMREREVLRLVGIGLTNPEIAQRLFISRKTAAHHVSSVLAKLDVRNRAEAVAYATRTVKEAR